MTRRLSQLIKMLMSRQRHPAAAPIVPIAPYSRSAAPGRVCLLCANTARGRTGPAAGRDPPGSRGRIPGEAPGGGTGRRAAEIGSAGMLILPCVIPRAGK